MGDALVIDLNGGIGQAAWKRLADGGREFHDAIVIFVDAELCARGQHAVAFDSADDFFADGRVGSEQAGAAVLGAPQTTVLRPSGPALITALTL